MPKSETGEISYTNSAEVNGVQSLNESEGIIENAVHSAQSTDILSAVRNYLLLCPVFGEKRIAVDSLMPNENSFSIGTMPQDEQLRAYIGGGALRQFVFEISKSESTADTDEQNAKNAAVFEQLSSYFKKQTQIKNLPLLPVGNSAHKIEAISSGYLEKHEQNTRIYIIQCRVLYTQKGER